MKTNEELNSPKEEVEVLHKKLAELNEDELKQVSGGGTTSFYIRQSCGKRFGRVGTTDVTVTCKCGGSARLDQVWEY